MIAGLAVDIRPLIKAAVATAATSGSASRMRRSAPRPPTSQWVEQAAAAIEHAGGQLATVADVRRTLADRR